MRSPAPARPRATVAVRARPRGVCAALGRRAIAVRPVGPRTALQRRGLHRLPCGEWTRPPAPDRRGADALDAGAAERPGAGCARRPRPRPGVRRSAPVRRCARESAGGGRGVLALDARRRSYSRTARPSRCAHRRSSFAISILVRSERRPCNPSESLRRCSVSACSRRCPTPRCSPSPRSRSAWALRAGRTRCGTGRSKPPWRAASA